jgi:hypothetical protein
LELVQVEPQARRCVGVQRGRLRGDRRLEAQFATAFQGDRVAEQIGALVAGFLEDARFLPAVGMGAVGEGLARALGGQGEKGGGLAVHRAGAGFDPALAPPVVVGFGGGIAPQFHPGAEDRVEAARQDVVDLPRDAVVRIASQRAADVDEDADHLEAEDGRGARRRHHRIEGEGFRAQDADRRHAGAHLGGSGAFRRFGAGHFDQKLRLGAEHRRSGGVADQPRGQVDPRVAQVPGGGEQMRARFDRGELQVGRQAVGVRAARHGGAAFFVKGGGVEAGEVEGRGRCGDRADQGGGGARPPA